ncbi:MAG: hypothetical protein O3B01_26290 [Planctomycetota bacterium]|nr:hypothetical protein [Planctomycetota bacterium]MDA1142086.1 hypothetical protein [Planctomycetota bacterium]
MRYADVYLERVCELVGARKAWIFAPKGLNMSDQGNALANWTEKQNASPERASQAVTPFQG